MTELEQHLKRETLFDGESVMKYFMPCDVGDEITAITDYYRGEEKLLTKGNLYEVRNFTTSEINGTPCYVIINDQGEEYVVSIFDKRIFYINWEDRFGIITGRDSVGLLYIGCFDISTYNIQELRMAV
ncbi:MAG TPA: hypothetical protein PLO82_12040 [Bacteroidia bacterium]|nr:hypothetical protein [Bacteroidia bacterium]